jgi:hypothetical protein
MLEFFRIAFERDERFQQKIIAVYKLAVVSTGAASVAQYAFEAEDRNG